MKVYLAGDAPYNSDVFKKVNYGFNRLETFWSIYNKAQVEENITLYNDFLLDSGAFTFIMASKKSTKLNIDIDYFIDAYCDYINSFNISKFFEMDVDAVYGYEKVLQLRKRIEQRTGRQPIIVFHKERGWNEYLNHIKNYSYVALGGYAAKTAKWTPDIMRKFVFEASNYGTKVHGLGVTSMKYLKEVPLYSVDSSTWTAGNRFRSLCIFDGLEVKPRLKSSLDNKLISSHEQLALFNLKEWIKFAKYMENRRTL